MLLKEFLGIPLEERNPSYDYTTLNNKELYIFHDNFKQPWICAYIDIENEILSDEWYTRRVEKINIDGRKLAIWIV